jgi:hypothetical protein
MARTETWLTSNFNKILNIESMGNAEIQKNNGGNLIGVKLYNGDDPFQINETIKGLIVLSNNTTITVNGLSTGNKAYIELPSSVYNVPGPITISIKMGSTTIGSCCGTVKPI